jgi:solute:Na+ symporter, SSS family
MPLSPWDIAVFVTFIVIVVGVGIVMSRHESDSESYFLAGRSLRWWLIGVSLIAANISTEQFVGMSGQAADYQGLAPASYEWLAAITLVVVAFFFLPFFLRAGIFTMPEFLEHRYNHVARALMALCMLPILVLLVAAVTYSGALTIKTAFENQMLLGVLPMNVTTGAWLIGLMAGTYVVCGGLKACAWADLIQGTALIIGGAIICFCALRLLGETRLEALATTAALPADLTDDSSGVAKFMALNAHKLHMVLPADDLNIPWTALLIGLWIPNFYYWGLNQYITQRILGSASLREGQRGIVFAAGLKLVIPFIIIFPGMIAFNLFSHDMKVAADEMNAETVDRFHELKTSDAALTMELYTYDAQFARGNPALADAMERHNEAVRQEHETNGAAIEQEHKLLGYRFDTAFGLLLRRVLPRGIGVYGFVLAAILGAVVSSLAAMLNAASTIFTLDIFKKYLVPNASQQEVVLTGRMCVGAVMVVGCVIAPTLGNPRIASSIFRLIQESQGYIEPGLLAAFTFGLISRRTPAIAGVLALLLGPVLYGLLQFGVPSIAFLNRIAICYVALLIMMGVLTVVAPRRQPVMSPLATTLNLESSRSAKIAGAIVVAVTLVLYWVFW